MNIPDNIPIVYYFAAQGKEANQKIADFLEENKEVTLLSMTDIGYFYNNIQTKQGNA